MVDVRMKHFREKANLWRFVWVLLRELQVELEGAILPDGILRPNDNCSPLHDIIFFRTRDDVGVVFCLDLLEVAHESFSCLGCHTSRLLL